MTSIRVSKYSFRTIILCKIFLCFQLADLCIAACKEEECCSETDKPRMHISMQLGKNMTLCLDYSDYRLANLALLDNNNCDGVDDYDTPSVNSTYNCTVVNVAQKASFEAKVCEQLVTIECARTVPISIINGCNGEDFSDGDEGGCSSNDGSNSDGAGQDDDEGGVEGYDDIPEEDLVLCLLLENTNQSPKLSCNVYINVAMADPGRWEVENG